MRVEIRADDQVHIEGYVNAVGRDSRPLPSPRGKFVEQVAPGVFNRACAKKKPAVMLDHKRALDADAEFNEDNIGLHISADIRDREVAGKAKRGELRGWSFGFSVNPGGEQWEDGAQPYPRRTLTDISLDEVSIIDTDMTPCYVGTSVETRAEQEITSEIRSADSEPNEIIDNTDNDKGIKIKIEIELLMKQFELFKERNLI